ncbi:hypothetical protein NKJ13_31335 [Mesorhizobium sp. M0174]|uniref:hypothetical protein n=1 Tax=Mesorhizobium sp. M0174 TaxID=2956904 RepID=UPI00333C2A1E
MTKHQIEDTSVERRWRWSRDEKERLVAAAFKPGQCFRDRAIGWPSCEPDFPVAQGTLPDFAPSVPHLVPVEVVEATQSPISRSRKKSSTVTIELGGARRLRVESDLDSEALWSGDDLDPERCEGVARHTGYTDMRKDFPACR